MIEWCILGFTWLTWPVICGSPRSDYATMLLLGLGFHATKQAIVSLKKYPEKTEVKGGVGVKPLGNQHVEESGEKGNEQFMWKKSYSLSALTITVGQKLPLSITIGQKWLNWNGETWSHSLVLTAPNMVTFTCVTACHWWRGGNYRPIHGDWWRLIQTVAAAILGTGP